MPAATGLAEMK